MLRNKPSKDRFDQMLGRALRATSEPVPDHFTDKLLTRIREAEERRILARVVMQERLALAGCIMLGTIVIVMAAVLPSIATSFTEQIEAFVYKTSQAIEAASGRWQFFAVFAAAFGFAVYSLVNLLVGDS